MALRDRITESEHTARYVAYSCPECGFVEVQADVPDASYYALKRLRSHVDETNHHPTARVETHTVQEFEVTD